MGLSATFLLYWMLALRDARLTRAEFGRGADVCASMIEREFVSGLEAIDSLMALYASSIAVERHEFHAFCRWQLEHKTFIRALQWAPRTPGASRRGYEEGIRLATAEKPTQPVGTGFRYSDVNFVLLGEVVRRVAGESLAGFAERVLYRPLGMGATGFVLATNRWALVAPTERGAVFDSATTN